MVRPNQGVQVLAEWAARLGEMLRAGLGRAGLGWADGADRIISALRNRGYRGSPAPTTIKPTSGGLNPVVGSGGGKASEMSVISNFSLPTTFNVRNSSGVYGGVLLCSMWYVQSSENYYRTRPLRSSSTGRLCYELPKAVIRPNFTCVGPKRRGKP